MQALYPGTAFPMLVHMRPSHRRPGVIATHSCKTPIKGNLITIPFLKPSITKALKRPLGERLSVGFRTLGKRSYSLGCKY